MANQSTEDNRQLVIRHFEEFVNQRDLSAIDRNMAVDFVDHDGPVGQSVGRDADRAMMARMHSAFADLRIHLNDVLADRDLVCVRAIWTGTDGSSGKRMSSHGFVLWRISDEKIAER